MFVLEVTFDSQCAPPEKSLRRREKTRSPLFAGPELSLEEFSADELARLCGFRDVKWDDVEDDTPGSLTLGYDSAQFRLR